MIIFYGNVSTVFINCDTFMIIFYGNVSTVFINCDTFMIIFYGNVSTYVLILYPLNYKGYWTIA